MDATKLSEAKGVVGFLQRMGNTSHGIASLSNREREVLLAYITYLEAALTDRALHAENVNLRKSQP